jgi:hypothetical protein
MGSSIEGSKSIVMDELVLYIDAANPRCYTPSATTLEELTEVNTGDLKGGVGYSSDKLGEWTLDGTDDHIDLGPRLPILNLTYPMSIDIWFKPTLLGVTDTKGIFAGAINPTNTVYLGFSINLVIPAYTIEALIGDGTGNGPGSRRSLFTTQSVNAGAWNHVVATASTGPVFEVYINGVLSSGTTSGTGGAISWGSGASTQIGKVAGYNRFFTGSVASVKYYNKKLSASEVLQNYNATRTRFGL